MQQIAHAKLTLRLHMTGVRDDGYHLIDAEMVSLDLADTLEFSEGDGIEIVGPEAEGVPASADNLIAKALRAAGKKAHVRVTKNIPAGGGLGGGSSDAAAALRFVGAQDVQMAASLGADVPFCLNGGRAAVEGIGELLTPLPYEEREFTLLLPPFGVDTAAVYKEFDAAPETDPAVLNHLEAAAIRVEPRLAGWKEFLESRTRQTAVLAGSGSTWFVEGAFASPGEDQLAGARWINTKTVNINALQK